MNLLPQKYKKFTTQENDLYIKLSITNTKITKRLIKLKIQIPISISYQTNNNIKHNSSLISNQKIQFHNHNVTI